MKSQVSPGVVAVIVVIVVVILALVAWKVFGKPSAGTNPYESRGAPASGSMSGSGAPTSGPTGGG